MPIRTGETDEELACHAQAGSLVSFERLVSRYELRLFQFLRHKTPSFEDAQDLTQQTFIICYRQLARFDPRYRFATWLFTIARRQAIAFYRSRPAADPPFPEEQDLGDPSRRLHEHESETTLWNWVKERLSERQFSAFWLRTHEDFSINEIARSMGLTQIHVKVLLFRARQKLAREWPPSDRISVKPAAERSSRQSDLHPAQERKAYVVPTH